MRRTISDLEGQNKTLREESNKLKEVSWTDEYKWRRESDQLQERLRNLNLVSCEGCGGPEDDVEGTIY